MSADDHQQHGQNLPLVSVVMPCLNEADTVATCVAKARRALESAGISFEVIVADNGSRDGSQALATAAGARVVDVAEPGYGSALMGGIAAARGRYIIMGDADDSYDFGEAPKFVAKLQQVLPVEPRHRLRREDGPGEGAQGYDKKHSHIMVL